MEATLAGLRNYGPIIREQLVELFLADCDRRDCNETNFVDVASLQAHSSADLALGAATLLGRGLLGGLLFGGFLGHSLFLWRFGLANGAVSLFVVSTPPVGE